MQNTMKVLAQVAGELTVMVQPPEGRPPKGDEAGAVFFLHPREFAYGGGVVGGGAPAFAVFLGGRGMPPLFRKSAPPLHFLRPDGGSPPPPHPQPPPRPPPTPHR